MRWQTGRAHLGTPVEACTDLHKSYGFMNDIKFLGEILQDALVEITNSPYVGYAVYRDRLMIRGRYVTYLSRTGSTQQCDNNN